MKSASDQPGSYKIEWWIYWKYIYTHLPLVCGHEYLSLFTLIWSHLCILPLFFFLYIRSNTVSQGMSYQFHKIIYVYWPIMHLQGSPTSIKKRSASCWNTIDVACNGMFLIIISAQTGYFMDVVCWYDLHMHCIYITPNLTQNASPALKLF